MSLGASSPTTRGSIDAARPTSVPFTVMGSPLGMSAFISGTKSQSDASASVVVVAPPDDCSVEEFGEMVGEEPELGIVVDES